MVQFTCPILVATCDECPFCVKENHEFSFSPLPDMRITQTSRKCMWAKIKEAYQKERMEKNKSIQPIESKNMSLVPVGIIKVYKPAFLYQVVMRAKCSSCQTPYSGNEVKSYPHKDGIFVEGYQQKQWVYAQCKKCNYQTALWKIFQDMGFQL